MKVTGSDVSERLADFISFADKFEDEVGLSNCKYMDLSEEDVKQMSPDDLDGAAYSLYAYSTYLQRCANRQQAIANWADQTFRKILGIEHSSAVVQRGFTLEEKRMLLVAHNEGALKLSQIRGAAQAKLDTLQFLNMRIQAQAEHLTKMAETKRRRR